MVFFAKSLPRLPIFLLLTIFLTASIKNWCRASVTLQFRYNELPVELANSAAYKQKQAPIPTVGFVADKMVTWSTSAHEEPVLMELANMWGNEAKAGTISKEQFEKNMGMLVNGRMLTNQYGIRKMETIEAANGKKLGAIFIGDTPVREYFMRHPKKANIKTLEDLASVIDESHRTLALNRQHNVQSQEYPMTDFRHFYSAEVGRTRPPKPDGQENNNNKFGGMFRRGGGGGPNKKAKIRKDDGNVQTMGWMSEEMKREAEDIFGSGQNDIKTMTREQALGHVRQLFETHSKRMYSPNPVSASHDVVIKTSANDRLERHTHWDERELANLPTFSSLSEGNAKKKRTTEEILANVIDNHQWQWKHVRNKGLMGQMMQFEKGRQRFGPTLAAMEAEEKLATAQGRYPNYDPMLKMFTESGNQAAAKGRRRSSNDRGRWQEPPHTPAEGPVKMRNPNAIGMEAHSPGRRAGKIMNHI